MSGAACGAWCGYCGRCESDYATRCASKDCRNAVTFPDIDIYCSPCLEKQRLDAIRQEQARLHQRMELHRDMRRQLGIEPDAMIPAKGAA